MAVVNIGKDNMFMPTVGKHSKHKSTKENGNFLTDFAKEKWKGIKAHGEFRKVEGTYAYQIDHGLVEKYEHKWITDM